MRAKSRRQANRAWPCICMCLPSESSQSVNDDLWRRRFDCAVSRSRFRHRDHEEPGCMLADSLSSRDRRSQAGEQDRTNFVRGAWRDHTLTQCSKKTGGCNVAKDSPAWLLEKVVMTEDPVAVTVRDSRHGASSLTISSLRQVLQLGPANVVRHGESRGSRPRCRRMEVKQQTKREVLSFAKSNTSETVPVESWVET